MGNIIDAKGAMKFGKIDVDEDDTEELQWVETLVEAAEAYLKNATGKEYPETIEGIAQSYPLEKLYCGMLVSFWYDNRDLVGSTNEEFAIMTKALMIQLKA